MNICVGDYIEFTLPQFEGGSFASRGRSRFGRAGHYTGDKAFAGTVERDWYDTNRRHWFSIRLLDGGLKRVQGRNLYGRVSLHRPGAQHDVEAEAKTGRKNLNQCGFTA